MQHNDAEGTRAPTKCTRLTERSQIKEKSPPQQHTSMSSSDQESVLLAKAIRSKAVQPSCREEAEAGAGANGCGVVLNFLRRSSYTI